VLCSYAHVVRQTTTPRVLSVQLCGGVIARVRVCIQGRLRSAWLAQQYCIRQGYSMSVPAREAQRIGACTVAIAEP